MDKSEEQAQSNTIKVWDLPLRLFHWALAAGFTVSFISVKTDNMEIHIISATCVLGLLIFRLIWGFTGSYHSRFLSFIPGQGTLKQYLKCQGPEPVGHSPVGALSVFALLLFLILQLLTGLVADDEIYITGPLRDYVSDDQASWATSKHAFLSDILLGLVALHIAAILFYWMFKKNNLIKPMLTGYKTLHEVTKEQQQVSYNKLIAVLVAVCSATLAFGVFNWI